MSAAELDDFTARQGEALLKNIERDLGKKEALKYERSIRDFKLGTVKDIIKLKIVDTQSMRGMIAEKDPTIKGRATYNIFKENVGNPKMKLLIAASLEMTDHYKDMELVNAYLEAMIEDKFGKDYRDLYRDKLKGNRPQAIENMYLNSKEFNSDSKEDKNEKLGIINDMKFYIDSRTGAGAKESGKHITSRLFGFDYPRK